MKKLTIMIGIVVVAVAGLNFQGTQAWAQTQYIVDRVSGMIVPDPHPQPDSAVTSPTTDATFSPGNATASAAAARDDQLLAQREVNRRLKDRSDKEWFLIGAGTLLVGFISGLIVSKIQWRRKSWHSF